MKTFKFSLVLRTRENTDVFISLDDNIYGIHRKRINILYLFVLSGIGWSIVPAYTTVLFQGSTLNGFGDILLTRFHPYFFKGRISGKGHNLDEKKNVVSYFFMRYPYIKFQNPSMHSSKVMLCIKKHAM